METVYIVAILAAAAGIVVLVVLLRQRLTHLVVRYGKGALELKAKPRDEHPPAQSKGVVLDSSTVSKSKVKVSDSSFVARESKVKGSEFDVSGSEDTDDRTDG